VYNDHELLTFGVNKTNIIDWANLWHTKNSNIPKFKLTGRSEHADIRVEFGEYKIKY